MTAFVANTNLLELQGFKDEVAGTYINDATVTATVLDETEAEVSGVTFPVTLDYVAASKGDYRAVLSEDLALTADKFYTAVITADGGTDRTGVWRFPFRAQHRTE